MVGYARHGRRARYSAQSCRASDPTCDADGTANGSCSFKVAVCLNVSDPRLLERSGEMACSPSSIVVWQVRRPLPDSKPPGDANGAAPRDAVGSLGTAAVSGKHDETLTFTPAVAGTQTCTGFVPVVVPLRDSLVAGRAVVKTTVATSSGDADTDKLKLACLPPP